MHLSDVLSRHRVIVVLVIALSGVFTSVTLRNRAFAEQNARIVSEFQQRAAHQSHSASEHLSIYPEMLAQLSSIGSFRPIVYWAMLKDSFEHIIERHPSIAIMDWVPIVRGANREHFETQNTEIQGRTVTLQQRQPDGSFLPAPFADFYYPLQTVVPIEGNESVIGYDLSSSPTFASFSQARETRSLVATPQFTLTQDNAAEDLLAVGLIMPVFIRQRDSEASKFRGYIQCVLKIHDTLSRLHHDSADEALLIHYEDASAGSNEGRIMYANLAGHEPPLSHAQTVALPVELDHSQPDLEIETFTIGGRQWRIIIQMNPAWAAAQRTQTPWLLLGGGVLVTLLLTLLVNSMLRRNREVELTVKQRTKALEETREMLEQDITQRVIAEKKLRESESLLRGVLDHSGSEIFVKDHRGRYILFNEKFRQTLRRETEEIFGHTDDELFDEKIAARFKESDHQVIESRDVVRCEVESNYLGRRRVDIVQKYPLFDGDGEIYAVGGIVTEISDRAEAEKLRQEYERKLQASQKMESLGVLAGGIAHDFNNILATVLGQASLMRRQGSLVAKQDRQIGLIEVAARRASDLCEQMLIYAGKAAHDTEKIDLNKIVEETTGLLKISLQKHITLATDLARPLDSIEANSTQIRQVVMNLIINASDAMKSTSGRVTIHTFQRHLPAEETPAIVGPAELSPGYYVGIEVTDTGPGISAENLQRIFEPFFTTKFLGRGLGLSTVLGIVQSSGGGVAVVSPPGGGTVFTLLFPATPSTETAAEDFPSAAVHATVWGGALIVDDEQQLRDLATALLESEDMTTFSAASGEEAIRIYQAHQDEIHVVLLDLTMPGMSGAATLIALRKINPNIRVIILSGYSPKDPKTRLGDLDFDAFLQKPYELFDLLREIAAVLPPRK